MVVNTMRSQQEPVQFGISCFVYAQGTSEHSAVHAQGAVMHMQ